MAENQLNQFIAQVKRGVAKTNRFFVELTLPQDLMNMGEIRDNMRKIALFCDQAQIPGLSFGTNPVRSFGETKEVPYEKLYEPIQLSFYVDDDFIVKKLFDSWMNLIQDTKTRTFRYPEYYLSNSINILVINNSEKERYIVTLHNVYPKAIAPIQLDYAAREVMKLNVTLSYQYSTMAALVPASPEAGGSGLFESAMGRFAYGFEEITEVPVDYLKDFSGFQSQWTDFTTGVKSFTSSENVGEITGFGGIFT